MVVAVILETPHVDDVAVTRLTTLSTVAPKVRRSDAQQYGAGGRSHRTKRPVPMENTGLDDVTPLPLGAGKVAARPHLHRPDAGPRAADAQPQLPTQLRQAGRRVVNPLVAGRPRRNVEHLVLKAEVNEARRLFVEDPLVGGEEERALEE